MNRHRPSSGLAFLAVTLMAFVVAAYGRYMALPFIGDDYVFLDRVTRESFADVWSRANADFGWYRPWSRDFHFWVVTHAAGLSGTAFRAVGFVLWTTGLLLYGALLIRITGVPIAAIATLGVASLSLWGTPLIWISGSQDLWMFCFAMACLLLFVSGRQVMSAVALMGALLSKETAAVIPLIALAFCWIVDRMKVRAALWRVRYLLLTIAVWLFLHPTLLLGKTAPPVNSGPITTTIAFVRSGLTTVNLDRWPMPRDVSSLDLLCWFLSAGIITASAAWLVLRARKPQAPAKTARPSTANSESFSNFDPTRWWKWGLAWGAIAFLPTLLPSTGWRAYYYGLGVAGIWLAFAVWLARRPRWAVGAVAALSLLRGPRAATPSWEWSESYLIRAGKLLSITRSELFRQRPTLAPHTRVFLARVPNNMGLIAGNSPAIRVWYRDHTLGADFYNRYRPRTSSEPPGEDLFFRFDSIRTLVEVVRGPEIVPAAMAANPTWQDDHQKLALLFVQSGDLDRAAQELEKLSQLADGLKAAVFASVCWSVLGDSTRSDSLLRSAQQRSGASWPEMLAWRRELLTTMPGRQGP